MVNMANKVQLKESYELLSYWAIELLWQLLHDSV